LNRTAGIAPEKAKTILKAVFLTINFSNPNFSILAASFLEKPNRNDQDCFFS